MEEIELTFLAKPEVKEKLKEAVKKEMLDIYVPASDAHPGLRMRKSGEKYEITRKRPVKEGDASHQIETTIPLTKEEFADLSVVKGKRIEKDRYIYKEGECAFEIDVFKGDLCGLVVVDVEFGSLEEKARFKMPKWCLVEVTQEKFVAGGMLCGKKYEDIEEDLGRFQYAKITI